MNDIMELRKKLGLSQIVFAEKLGVNVLTVRRWEKLVTRPSPMAQNAIKEVFGIEVGK